MLFFCIDVSKVQKCGISETMNKYIRPLTIIPVIAAVALAGLAFTPARAAVSQFVAQAVDVVVAQPSPMPVPTPSADPTAPVPQQGTAPALDPIVVVPPADLPAPAWNSDTGKYPIGTVFPAPPPSVLAAQPGHGAPCMPPGVLVGLDCIVPQPTPAPTAAPQPSPAPPAVPTPQPSPSPSPSPS